MRIVWLVVVGVAIFFAHRYYTEKIRPTGLERAPTEAAAVGGGTVREWQQAPDALMGMQGAIGNPGKNPSRAMMDTVRRGTKQAER